MTIDTILLMQEDGVLYLGIILLKKNPVFIWMSWNTHGKGINKIHWDRVFTTVIMKVKEDLHLIPFKLFIGNYVYRKWRKKRKLIND